MSKKSNNQGRAYEFICLITLHKAIKEIRPAEIINNSSFNAAYSAWTTLSETEQGLYSLSAKSTIETIFALEPNIIEEGNDVLELFIQQDKRGEEADVRDIIIQRSDIVWQIGLSVKHNHMAVKHCRLSHVLDFGEKWYGVKCSKEYWKDVKPIFDILESEKAKGTYFRAYPNKVEKIYLPILEAFKKEVTKQFNKDKKIARKLVEFLLSKYDFYKVISLDKKKITSIQSFNMYGSLNKPSRIKEPDIKIPVLDLPKDLYYFDYKKNSKATLLMCFDNGWQFSFRIHNAEDIMTPTLKFDVKIEGMPTNINITFNCKWQ